MLASEVEKVAILLVEQSELQLGVSVDGKVKIRYGAIGEKLNNLVVVNTAC